MTTQSGLKLFGGGGRGSIKNCVFIWQTVCKSVRSENIIENFLAIWIQWSKWTIYELSPHDIHVFLCNTFVFTFYKMMSHANTTNVVNCCLSNMLCFLKFFAFNLLHGNLPFILLLTLSTMYLHRLSFEQIK